MAKRALITGITGQDGSYLAELLLSKGYAVTGVVRERDTFANIDHILNQLNIVTGEIVDRFFVQELVAMKFDEIYNLASIATVVSPWETPLMVPAVPGNAPVYFLEAIRLSSPTTKFFQASSAEMFDPTAASPQNEVTACAPRNPYGAAKLYAHTMLEAYRNAHKLFAVSGILYNHESPRRPETFVTRKIVATLARIKAGSDEVLSLGNLDVKRDWGYAGDYVRAMWMSLQHNTPETFVIASGQAHTVRECVEIAARLLRIPLSWEGEGLLEVAKDSSGRVVVKIDPTFYRPAEQNARRGDISKIMLELGWKPEVSFETLIEMMVGAEKENLGLVDAPETALAIPSSPAELMDKISILKIKDERIVDPVKLRNVRAELELLLNEYYKLPQSEELGKLGEALKVVNESIWDAEELLRAHWEEDDKVLMYARIAHKENDERFRIKRRINELLGSSVVEVKSHQK